MSSPAGAGMKASVPTVAAEALHQHQQLADELHDKAVEEPALGHRSDPVVVPVSDSPPADAPLRQRLRHLIHSYKYQGVVIALVVLDSVCVIAELLIDLEISSDEGGQKVKEVLHNLSIAILSLFLLEIVLKLWVLRLELFRLPWELFDAVVVIVSFALDVAFRHSVGPINGAGLIILLRLWRVTRIVSGMVMSVRRHAEHKLELERAERGRLERQLAHTEAYCDALEGALRQHGLPLPGRPAAA